MEVMQGFSFLEKIDTSESGNRQDGDDGDDVLDRITIIKEEESEQTTSVAGAKKQKEEMLEYDDVLDEVENLDELLAVNVQEVKAMVEVEERRGEMRLGGADEDGYDELANS